MILVVVENIATARNMIYSASKLALQLDKKLTIVMKSNNYISNVTIENILTTTNEKPANICTVTSNSVSISQICEQYEALFLFQQISTKKRSEIQKKLNECRNLRIPYILFHNDYQPLDLNKVIVTVSFLEEDMEKAQFASAFGRFCNSHVILLTASDYGSKAANTTMKMVELFGKFNFSYEKLNAQKDSFKVDDEALTIAENSGAGLILVSASRDYGLDDIIFGPKELHLLKKTTLPVLLINPRGDLYTLCD